MSWKEKMKNVLPPAGQLDAHETSGFGVRRKDGSSPHGGIDFNYNVPGQAGLNLRHPNVYSPVDGTVVKEPGGKYGMVSIRDTKGFLHEILHLQSQSVSKGQPIKAGQPIGSMGGVGAGERQHVHYQIHDRSGNLVNPEAFWNNQQPASTYRPAPAVPSLEDFRASQALGESGPATFNERWAFSNPRGATRAIGDNNGIGVWWRHIGEDPKKMNLTATEPSWPLNAATRTADSARNVITGTQLIQGPNGLAVVDPTGAQTEANASPFESAHEAVPFASYPRMPHSAASPSWQTFNDQARELRLVPSQQQGDFDSPAVLRSLVDQGAAASAAPAPPDDMNELLKLRAIVQAVGSRGLFPIQ